MTTLTSSKNGDESVEKSSIIAEFVSSRFSRLRVGLGWANFLCFVRKATVGKYLLHVVQQRRACVSAERDERWASYPGILIRSKYSKVWIAFKNDRLCP